MGGSSPQALGTLAWGDGESCLGSGRSSRGACVAQQSARPGHSSLGGRGVLPTRLSVRKDGLPGAAVPKAQAHRPGGTASRA